MLVHWIWLAHRPGLPERMKAELLRHFQEPEDIYYADSASFSHIAGITPEMLEALEDKNLIPCEEILEACHREKLHILTYRDVNYPSRLRYIPDPPLILYYKGTLPDFDGSPLIGVVGTRKASAYGLTAAKRLGYQIGKCGGIVVSGMAFGIDGMAMRGALTADRSVVGILGCGADMVYPLSNKALFADVEKYGCILSEFPPGTPPYKWNFPKRNRIISGLSCGVLVVEAPEKSGALITANQALEQGRDVFVVPGNIDVPTFVGSNRLLRDGAIAVSSGWDILSEYQAQYPDKIRKADAPSHQTAYPDELDRLTESERSMGKVAQKLKLPRIKHNKKEKLNKKDVDKGGSPPYSDVNKELPKLSETEQRIVDALKSGERLVDDVIMETELPANQVSSALTMLAIKGIVEKLPGNRIRRKGY